MAALGLTALTDQRVRMSPAGVLTSPRGPTLGLTNHRWCSPSGAEIRNVTQPEVTLLVPATLMPVAVIITSTCGSGFGPGIVAKISPAPPTRIAAVVRNPTAVVTSRMGHKFRLSGRQSGRPGEVTRRNISA